MPVTIVATVGSASANSFTTLAEWTTYMESRLNSTSFDDATTDEKNRALCEATRELSTLGWYGYRTDDVQALAWPREWVFNPDDPNNDYFDNDVVPDRVKRATYELGLAFLKAGTTDVVSLDTSLNVKSQTIDVISTEYYEPGFRIKGLARYPAVMREIRPLLAAQGLTSPVVRG